MWNFIKIYFIYNFVDSSCQYSCANKESFFWPSFETVLSSFSFCSSSPFATADCLIRTELTKNTQVRKKDKLGTSFLLYISTKINTTLDGRGEVECRGADHADDDRVVEEDHNVHWEVKSAWWPTQDWFSSRPQIAPGPLSSFLRPDRSRSQGICAGLRWNGRQWDNQLWWSEWGLMKLKTKTFYKDKYNKTLHI